jgi:hypothetical protein
MEPGGQIVNALLMLEDLDVPPETPSTPDEWAAFFATHLARSQLVAPMSILARGFYLYQISSATKSEAALKWAELFRRATATDLDAYFAGGLVALVLTFAKTPEQIAGVVGPLPAIVTGNCGVKLQDVPGAYYSRRCKCLEEIAECIRHLEGNSNPNEFNLIPLQRFPLFRKQGVGVLPLYLSGVATSLCEGIYQEIITAALPPEKKITESLQDIGSVFGYLFEEYVLGLLEETFGCTRVLKKPKRSDNGNEAADGILICPEGIIVMQIKGRHVRGRDRFAWKCVEDAEADVRQTGLVDAVDQLVSRESLASCRKGLVAELAFGSLANMVIQPVVVTYEPVPLLGLALPVVQDQIRRVPLGPRDRPLIIVNVDELEALCSLPGGDTVWEVLQKFRSWSGSQTRTLRNFLFETRRLRDAAMVYRGDRVFQSLASSLRVEPQAS